ncbi:hypothetical protein Ga0074812_1661 [Parafrankia irregularis]|uniref:Uncharacterized protein n=1 Tax=Parafrankia irregularis TaxID=795642 RepID=A0A0S4R1H6_9ACTN|nr:hypothetical protein Ga0074812_1661 [Parafrankia irregularis]
MRGVGGVGAREPVDGGDIGDIGDVGVAAGRDGAGLLGPGVSAGRSRAIVNDLRTTEGAIRAQSESESEGRGQGGGFQRFGSWSAVGDSTSRMSNVSAAPL